jgi:hypothetical protein
VFPVKYELEFYINQKTTFFIVTAVKASNLTEVEGPDESLLLAEFLISWTFPSSDIRNRSCNI